MQPAHELSTDQPQKQGSSQAPSCWCRAHQHARKNVCKPSCPPHNAARWHTRQGLQDAARCKPQLYLISPLDDAASSHTQRHQRQCSKASAVHFWRHKELTGSPSSACRVSLAMALPSSTVSASNFTSRNLSTLGFQSVVSMLQHWQAATCSVASQTCSQHHAAAGRCSAGISKEYGTSRQDLYDMRASIRNLHRKARLW